eukprot:gene16356-22292_t
MVSKLSFKFSIDRGGTFTDIFCEVDDLVSKTSKNVIHKLLSVDPERYADAPTEGIRRILETETGISFEKGKLIDTSFIESIRMGTTVATNALLERNGEKIALITTKGFGDLQIIGNQSRPKIFDLEIKRPDQLFVHVAELDERVILIKEENFSKYSESEIITGVSSEKLFVEKKISESAVRFALSKIKEQGINSIAVVLMHSYTYPNHEQFVKKIAFEMGFEQVSLSSEVMPMIRAVPRGGTTCVDAYLTPVIKTYLKSFTKGFVNNLSDVNVSFMQSDGGLTPMDNFLGNKAILSGPAGGVVGYALTSQYYKYLLHDKNEDEKVVDVVPVIGFDMGGTSTDVSRYAGTFEHVYETTTAGITIQSPQLDINTVAAGGGSRLFFRNGLFVVGPQSAGAHPGPTCYRKYGPLTVTDANVLLGRIQCHLFPAIFGPNENELLDLNGTQKAFEELTKNINNYNNENSTGKLYTVDEVAYGFIRIANEAMARPIRNLTTMKGYDVTKHALACFGGAGPQHCCAIAKSLGIRKILVHRYSGILSAYGLSLANIVVEKQHPFNSTEVSNAIHLAKEKLDAMEKEAINELINQGFSIELISTTKYVNCRYQGTDTSTMTAIDDQTDAVTLVTKYIDNYKREYGFELMNRKVLIDDVRVRAVGNTSTANNYVAIISKLNNIKTRIQPIPKEFVSVYFEQGRLNTPVFILNELNSNNIVTGPAIIVQDVATVLVDPGCSAIITDDGDIIINIDE